MKTSTTHFWNEQKSKLKVFAAAIVLLAASGTSYAQQKKTVNKHGETYGHSLNLGVGIGYYHYAPFFSVNYEFDVAHNFTLAPFLGVSSYRSRDHYNWGGNRYYYRETILPMGVKGTYYFDEILGANSKWDFYLAASLGFVYSRVAWDDGYYGDKSGYRATSPLYLDGHIGAEYHAGKNVGLFLDLSTGVSTFGIAFHNL